jgi:hypothetical protein
MSFTKNNHIRCDTCGRLCRPYDEETPFGCADPEYPEPYDPFHYCKPCSKKLYRDWKRRLSESLHYGDWSKSLAEQRAAKELGLVWVHNGIGTYGTGDYIAPYQYTTKAEYERLKALPPYKNTTTILP